MAEFRNLKNVVKKISTVSQDEDLKTILICLYSKIAMNESAVILSAFENRLGAGLV